MPFDPVTGVARTLPEDLVPVVRDHAEIVRGTDVTEVQVKFGIMQLPPGPGAMRYGQRAFSTVFDLTRLPLDMHGPLAVIL